MEFKYKLSEGDSRMDIWWHSKFFQISRLSEKRLIGLSTVGKSCIVSALLHNARSCFYGAITWKYFECEPEITEDCFTH